jgi:ABC-type multidrug transport system fused ATPase/permease subunit
MKFHPYHNPPRSIRHAILTPLPSSQATSSLDTETEQLVQESLQALSSRITADGSQQLPRTLIVIAHRLTTVQDADVILVLEQGQLAESGTHEELMRRPDGRYAELITKMSHADPLLGPA